MRHIIIFIALISFVFKANSQNLQEMYNKSKSAYENKEYGSFLKIMKQLDSLRPSHPVFTYNLAAALVLNGKTEEALPVMAKSILMDNGVDFDQDADFEPVRSKPGYQRILALKQQQNKTVTGSGKVVVLKEKDLHPEGLTYLPKAKLWLAASIHKGKIIAFDSQTGVCTDWFIADKGFAVFAMKPDKNEKYLWVATAAIPEAQSFTKELEGKAVILRIDIAGKKITARFSVNGNHLFGDLAVTREGTVYVSDSAQPVLYKIENNTMDIFLDLSQEAFNLQGITLNTAASKLFVADYLKGILAVDIKNNNRKWLSFPEGTTGKGIDGLAYYKQSLIAIHNGIKPVRLMQYTLDDNEKTITACKILDSNRPEFNEPVLMTVQDKQIYFFANAPWNAYKKDHTLDLQQCDNPALYQYRLKE